MKRFSTQLLLALLSVTTCCFVSCDHLKRKTKDTIHKGGETVGKGSSEFINGVSEGIDQTFECRVNVSAQLKEKGLGYGKFKISNEVDGKNNLLSIYLIYDKDFKDTIMVKVFDRKGQEYGRTKITVEGKGGEAKYQDFTFDNRTNIESKSTFLIE